MPPAVLAGQLNEHRQAMNAAVLAQGGTVMRYVGDAVLAVFGAPNPQPDHETHGLCAAAQMHANQYDLNAICAVRNLPPFGMGVGLCTGEVAAAMLGSEERVEYTVVGDTVNLAARLCDAARPAGTGVASAATVMGSSITWDAQPPAPLQVKGRASSVSAYRIGPQSQTLLEATGDSGENRQ